MSDTDTFERTWGVQQIRGMSLPFFYFKTHAFETNTDVKEIYFLLRLEVLVMIDHLVQLRQLLWQRHIAQCGPIPDVTRRHMMKNTDAKLCIAKISANESG